MKDEHSSTPPPLNLSPCPKAHPLFGTSYSHLTRTKILLNTPSPLPVPSTSTPALFQAHPHLPTSGVGGRTNTPLNPIECPTQHPQPLPLSPCKPTSTPLPPILMGSGWDKGPPIPPLLGAAAETPPNPPILWGGGWSSREALLFPYWEGQVLKST